MILKELKDLTRSMEVLDLKKEADDIVPILKDLSDELFANDNLIALSAPQIGHNVRIFALKFSDEIRFFVNPLYVKRKELFVNREKCYSLGDQEYLIPRFKSVEFIYTKTNGKVEQLTFEGIAATQFQQMYDLLEGLTLEDYGLPIDPDFDELSEEEQRDITDQYLNSLTQLLDCLQEDIKSDPILREQQHTIDFLTSVALGETKIAQPKMNREQRRKANKQAKKMAKMKLNTDMVN